MAIVCKKCGYERLAHEDAPPTQCPSCGAFYTKAETYSRKTESSKKLELDQSVNEADATCNKDDLPNPGISRKNNQNQSNKRKLKIIQLLIVNRKEIVVAAFMSAVVYELIEMRSEFSSVKSDVSSIAFNLRSMKSDVSRPSSDVSSIESDFRSIKSDFGSIKSDVSSIKSDVGYIESDFRSIKSDVRQMMMQNGFR